MSNIFFDVDNSFDYSKERDRFIQNMNMLKAMSVEESTLYKKWIECKSMSDRYDSSKNTKSNIWRPKDIYNKETTLEEIKNLTPIVKQVSNDYEEMEWLNLRIFSHTMAFEQNPGRILRFLIIDQTTNKYLGAISLSSDVVGLTARDNYIKWTDKNKYDDGKLRCTSIATCIMSTQPFGYNFLGGKLVASLLSTKLIRDLWKNTYGDTLVGITTTSLYGQTSMYDAIPYWKSLGESAGKVFIKPDDDIYDVWHHWLQENKKSEYDRITTKTNDSAGPVTGIKQRILYSIMRELNIKPTDYTHGFKRGVYFLPFYENFDKFLRNEIPESELILKERLKSDLQGVIDWWKPKAQKRYIKLLENNRIKPEILYYNTLSFMSWEDTKTKFLNEVGR
jgi:hypothetical protein